MVMLCAVSVAISMRSEKIVSEGMVPSSATTIEPLESELLPAIPTEFRLADDESEEAAQMTTEGSTTPKLPDETTWASEHVSTAEIAVLVEPTNATEQVMPAQATSRPPLKPVQLSPPIATDDFPFDESPTSPTGPLTSSPAETDSFDTFAMPVKNVAETQTTEAFFQDQTRSDATQPDDSNDFAVDSTESSDLTFDQLPPLQHSETLPVSIEHGDNAFQAPTVAETAKPKNRIPAQLTSFPGKPVPSPEPASQPKQAAKPSPTADGDNLPAVLRNAKGFQLAEQPAVGEHWKDETPLTDNRAHVIPHIEGDFSPDPDRSLLPYDPYQQMDVYEGKTLNANQRPLVELGRPWYQLGQLSPGKTWLGKHNQVTPQFLVYGDVRTALASNTQAGDNVSQLAFEVNLDFDLNLTSTERFHMFMAPVDDGRNTRFLLDDDEFIDEFDADIDFGYFEGDLGAIVGGFTNQTLPFDLPFAVGVMPLLMQNGVWMEDAFLGVATTIPARNSARLGISNMDITFFAGYDKIDSDAFVGDDSAARMYGIASFIEALNGYFEIDYAFLDDRTVQDRSYHNIGIGYSRRYGRFLSNSTRMIVNAGQSTDVVENSADGVLLLSENSLITHAPSTLVPYANFFVGFDRPQSAARAAAAGGVLRNTGILFESDGMTGYPTLDPTANDTYGGAFGINLIADDFSQQLIVEMAALGTMNENATRNAAGPQYGLGFRYQLPLTNAIIFRMDGMYGFLEDDLDVRGLRMELRRKY